MGFHRKPANRTRNKKEFTRTAGMVHRENLRARPMRGGFRL